MKKVFVGKVISDKMQKTVVVQMNRKVKHPLYQKLIKKSKKLKADTNGLSPVFGQIVKIEETRPLSRDKYFKVVEILQEAKPAKLSEDTLKKHEEEVEVTDKVEVKEIKTEVKEKKARKAKKEEK